MAGSDIDARLKQLEERMKEGDLYQGRVIFGEASNAIQLLLDYIVSNRTKTAPMFGKGMAKKEKNLGLNDTYDQEYNTLTEMFNRDQQATGEAETQGRMKLHKLKLTCGITCETEQFMKEVVHCRDSTIQYVDRNVQSRSTGNRRG